MNTVYGLLFGTVQKLAASVGSYVMDEVSELSSVPQSIDDLRGLSQLLEEHASEAEKHGDDQLTKYLVQRSRQLAAEAKRIVNDYKSNFGTEITERWVNSILSPARLNCINKDIKKLKVAATEFLENMAALQDLMKNKEAAAVDRQLQSIHVECSVNLDGFLQELKAFCNGLRQPIEEEKETTE